jgi:DNA invertase Pin-like site-specific DNA recombinase
MASNQKVLTYSRVSTAHHDQNPDVQVQELRRYCQARNWKITHEIVDHGFSGSTDNRPGLKTLFQLVRSRKVDTVVVPKLDRLFRSLKHLVITLEEFQTLGIEFVAIRDHLDYTTPSGRLFVQILGSLGEFERSLLRERTLLGLAHAKATGKRLGRPRLNNEDAIRKLRNRGLTYGQIEDRLKVSRGAIYRALNSTDVPKTPFEVPLKTSIKSGGEEV